MPCRDGGPSCGFGSDHVDFAKHIDEVQKVQDRLDNVTAMLCDTLQRMEGRHADGIVLASLATDTIVWWQQHKKVDAKRKELEQAEAELKAATEKVKRLRNG